jgi:hypothetical protein
MVQLSATRCICIAILWVIVVSFTAITFCAASRVLIVVSIYFVIDSVRKLMDTPSYISSTYTSIQEEETKNGHTSTWWFWKICEYSVRGFGPVTQKKRDIIPDVIRNSSGNALDLYWGDPLFESRPGYWLSCLRTSSVCQGELWVGQNIETYRSCLVLKQCIHLAILLWQLNRVIKQSENQWHINAVDAFSGYDRRTRWTAYGHPEL